MSGIIKFHHAAASKSVRSFPAPAPSPGRSPSAKDRAAQAEAKAEIKALTAEVAALNNLLAERDAAIISLGEEAERRVREGEALGREIGLAEADERHAERLAGLSDGVADAVGRFAAEIASLERLAALVAREGLGKILGAGSASAELLPGILRRCVEKIDARSIIRVEVSREDFADGQELGTIAAAAGRPGLEVVACDSLKSGDCRIKLALGGIDVGLNQQWGRLTTLLEALAEP